MVLKKKLILTVTLAIIDYVPEAWGQQPYLKRDSTQVCSCEFCDTFKNKFFHRAPPVAASAIWQFQQCF